MLCDKDYRISIVQQGTKGKQIINMISLHVKYIVFKHLFFNLNWRHLTQ